MSPRPTPCGRRCRGPRCPSRAPWCSSAHGGPGASQAGPGAVPTGAGGNLPSECAIVGFARRDWTDAVLRAEYEKTLAKEGDTAEFRAVWNPFASRLFFASGTFDDLEGYRKLAATLEEIDRTQGTRGNRVFYLAVSPEYFATIIQRLGEAGLIYPRQQQSPWSRVVIEKPFGRDLASARQLNLDVSRVLDESQVFRIDHYLGKETVQNILALRFGNSIYEPIWNRRYVHSVQVTVAEEVGMAGGRAPITTPPARSATWCRTT